MSLTHGFYTGTVDMQFTESRSATEAELHELSQLCLITIISSAVCGSLIYRRIDLYRKYFCCGLLPALSRNSLWPVARVHCWESSLCMILRQHIDGRYPIQLSACNDENCAFEAKSGEEG